MKAEIVSVGTELLLGQIADTNAQELGKVLAEMGIIHLHRQTVGDNLDRLSEALSLALSRSDIVFTIGGLGPTQDDLTRDGIARALDDELIHDPQIEADLKRLFEERKLPWVNSQTRQAMRPSTALPVDNPNGTAPGLICEKEGKVVIAMPGPKGEFVPMLRGPIREYLQQHSGGEIFHSRIIRICGMGESLVEERVRPLLSGSNPTVAPYAHVGEVHLRVTARATNLEIAEAMIRPVEQRIREALGEAVYACDDVTLEQAVIDLLRPRTVAVAESITGGGLGARFTSIAGSGDVFLGGVITYDIELKKRILGISSKLLDDENIGPVSEPVAREMAERIRDMAGADFGVGVTGNAGPTSDKGDKPVGLVYVGVAWEGGSEVEEHHFRGERDAITRRSSQAALVLLRKVAMMQENLPS